MEKGQSQEPLMYSALAHDTEDCDYYDNLSIRKAIVLSRYIRVLRDWIQNDERKQSTGGTLLPTKSRGRSESFVSNDYQRRIQAFLKYFERESEQIEDDELTRDLNVIRHLI